MEEKRDKMLEVFYDSQSFFQVLDFALSLLIRFLDTEQGWNHLEFVLEKSKLKIN